MDAIAALCDGCSAPCSRTIRIARSRISGEYRLGRAIGSISTNGPSDKPGTIHERRREPIVEMRRRDDARDAGEERELQDHAPDGRRRLLDRAHQARRRAVQQESDEQESQVQMFKLIAFRGSPACMK